MKWLILLFLLPSAIACTQADPCPWNIDIEADLLESSLENATAGDWYEVEIFNFADEKRTLTIGDHGSVDVESIDSSDFGVIQIGTESILVSDASGPSFMVNVMDGDFIDAGESAQASEAASNEAAKETPAPFALLLVGLAALARRK